MKDNSARFREQVRARVVKAIAVSCHQIQKEALKTLGKSNVEGWNPSEDGEPPHRNMGNQRRGVAMHVDEKKLVGYVGIMKGFKQLLFMELGTAAHYISGHGKMLKIPFRAKDSKSPREPTNDEIIELGLVQDGHWGTTKAGRGKDKGKRIGVGKWFFFRPFVYHPGTAKRPWLVPAAKRSREFIRRAFRGVSGGTPDVTFDKAAGGPERIDV